MESFSGNLISLRRIRTNRFSLRENSDGSGLMESLRTHGLLQPLTVVAEGRFFQLVNGHRRFDALKKLKKKAASAWVLPAEDVRKLFFAALIGNHPASYTDLDRCQIIQKASAHFHFADDDLKDTVLPLIGLPPSAKLLSQYREVSGLPVSALKLIRDQALPFQGSYWLAKFERSDFEFLIRKIFKKIKPTASQLAHLCEWLLDLIHNRKQTLAELFRKEKLGFEKNQDSRAAAERLYQAVRSLRFPGLTAKEKAFMREAQILQGKVRGLEIRPPENFENEGFYLRAHIRSAREMEDLSRQIGEVQKQASALFDTLL